MFQQIMVFAVAAFLLATTSLAKAEENDNDRRLPSKSQLASIATWLSTRFDLPLSPEPPRVELVPAGKLAQLRYKGLVMEKPEAGSSHVIGGEHATPVVWPRREVVAVYNDAKMTIYLADTWKPDSPADESVLVHEMVHHLQNRGAVKYECPAAREKPAYLAQKDWLEARGLKLEQEFDTDLFTVVAMSACMG